MTAPPDDLPRLSRARDASSTGYVEVTGRRAALLGDERGIFECWIWPLKIAHGIRLFVRHQGERIAASDLPGRVEVRPERVRLEHRHPLFRVQMTAFAALDRRALILLFDVDCDTELELELVVEPDFRPMWPAGMGGQIGARDPESGAFLLTEELGRFAALIGSPGAAPPEQSADHALPRDPVSIRVRVGPSRSDHGPIPFFIAGAETDPGPLSDAARLGDEGAALGHARSARVVAMAREEYSRLAREWPALLEEHVQHWRDFLARTTTIETGDALHDEAFLWAKIAIEKCWVEVDGLGRGLVAGLATSGSGERPGFGWFFDGDAMVAARAMLAYGDFEGARRVLEFAASHQRADGKMMHELTLSARLCNWIEDYPYAYYKGVNTPDFIAAVAEYFDATGDVAFLESMRPNLERAFEHCLACVDGDGLYSVKKAGLCAVEAGPLCGMIRSEVFAQGLWISALAALGGFRSIEPGSELAERAIAEIPRACQAFDVFWIKERRPFGFRHGFAVLDDGSLSTDTSGYLAQPASLRRSLPGVEEAAGAERRFIFQLSFSVASLNRPELATDWGVRLFATDAKAFDPESYNTGSVFPYLNHFGILALYRSGWTAAGYQLLRSQLHLHGFSGLGFVPEHLRADRAIAPPRGVPHQIFSSATIVLSTVQALLDIRGRRGEAVEIRASLPLHCREIRLTRCRLGESRFDLAITRVRESGRSVLRLRATRREGPSIAIVLLAARRQDAARADFARCEGDHPHRLDGSVECEVTFVSPLELQFDPAPLEVGQASQDLRIESGWERDERWEKFAVWTLFGRAGRTYHVRYYSDVDFKLEGAEVVDDATIRVRMPDGDPETFVETTVRAYWEKESGLG